VSGAGVAGTEVAGGVEGPAAVFDWLPPLDVWTGIVVGVVAVDNIGLVVAGIRPRECQVRRAGGGGNCGIMICANTR